MRNLRNVLILLSVFVTATAWAGKVEDVLAQVKNNCNGLVISNQKAIEQVKPLFISCEPRYSHEKAKMVKLNLTINDVVSGQLPKNGCSVECLHIVEPRYYTVSNTFNEERRQPQERRASKCESAQ